MATSNPNAGVEGVALCRMFKQAISGESLPRRLSSDHIRYSSSTAGRPICGFWAWKRCKRRPGFLCHIGLSNGSFSSSPWRNSCNLLMLVYTVLMVLVQSRILVKLIFAIENEMADYIQQFDPEKW
jgi:hypothetical protein